MKTGNIDEINTAAPVPLVLDQLRDHFRRTYLLNETQVETMLASSSKSLRMALASATEIINEKETQARFTMIFHSLKGLLLNMGELEWAEFSKELENKLKKGEQIDYAATVEIMEKGWVQILSYGEGTVRKTALGE